jgi:hypothetical protein
MKRTLIYCPSWTNDFCDSLGIERDDLIPIRFIQHEGGKYLNWWDIPKRVRQLFREGSIRIYQDHDKFFLEECTRIDKDTLQLHLYPAYSVLTYDKHSFTITKPEQIKHLTIPR